MECFFEEFFLPVRSPDFEFNFCPVRPSQMEMHCRPCTLAPQAFDHGKMRPVQSVGNAENRGELHYDVPLIGIELGESFVSHFWMALPVVAGNVCDNLFFILREAEQLGIADEVVRVTVMLGMRNE